MNSFKKNSYRIWMQKMYVYFNNRKLIRNILKTNINDIIDIIINVPWIKHYIFISINTNHNENIFVWYSGLYDDNSS